jgi:hypothetical protein
MVYGVSTIMTWRGSQNYFKSGEGEVQIQPKNINVYVYEQKYLKLTHVLPAHRKGQSYDCFLKWALLLLQSDGLLAPLISSIC